MAESVEEEMVPIKKEILTDEETCTVYIKEEDVKTEFNETSGFKILFSIF